MRGQVASLNAATAGAIALYHAWGKRGYAGDHTGGAAAQKGTPGNQPRG
jgi:hypothetical protein